MLDTSHLLRVQEEERRRIARELHDDIGQRLSFLDLLLTQAATVEDQAQRTERLQQAHELLQALNTDVRSVSHRLHPSILEDLGLVASLEALVQDFNRVEGMRATFQVREVPRLAFQPALLAIYRIAQEALRNVSKHAGPTSVRVSLSFAENHLSLAINDQGIGFDPEEPRTRTRLGILSMKERAALAGGTFQLHSSHGKGTTVLVEIPFDATP